MKFKCEKCSTRYTIADEKIRRKVLKIRCKICEHVIIVRDPGSGTDVATPAPRVAGLFDTGGDSVSGDVEDRTVITDPLGPLLDVEWYAAPGGEQLGPMPFERLRDMIKRQEIGGDDVVWNETMGDWAAVRDVPELAKLLHERHPPPPPLPPSLRRPPPAPSEALIAPTVPDGGLGLDLSAPPQGGFGLDLSAAPEAAPARPVEEPSAAPEPLEPLFGAGFFEQSAAPEPAPAEADTEAHLALGPPVGEPHMPLFPEQVSGEQAVVAVPPPTPSAPAPPPSPGVDPHHEIMGTSELRALAAPPAKNWLPIAIGVLLLGLGIGLGVALAPGGGPAPVADAPPIAPPVKPAVAAIPPRPAPLPDPKVAAPKADAAVVAAAPDAGTKAIAKRPERPRPAARPKPRPAPAETPKKPASGRFGSLDDGKPQVAVVAPAATPSQALPETINQGQILSVIKRHQRGVRTCYERQLKRDDSLQSAKIMLRFSIQGGGRTSNVRLPRRYDGTVLKTCLAALVGRWRFPRFSGEAIPVEYPLVLQASL